MLRSKLLVWQPLHSGLETQGPDQTKPLLKRVIDKRRECVNYDFLCIYKGCLSSAILQPEPQSLGDIVLLINKH